MTSLGSALGLSGFDAYPGVVLMNISFTNGS